MKFFFYFLILLILSGLLVFLYKKNISNTQEIVKPVIEKFVPQDTKKEIKIGKVSLLVEVADTPEKRGVGLSGRDSLPENEGMLFVFEKKDVSVPFWMKDMRFPIDMIWINDGKVDQFLENIQPQPENTPENKLRFYVSYNLIDYVLEVNAGFVAKSKIAVGDPVELPEI